MEWSWIKYQVINKYGFIKNIIKFRFFHKEFSISEIKKYAGRKILNMSETNVLIANMVRSEKPFMVCRFGATEMNAIVSYLQVKHFPYFDNREKAIHKLCKTAGFFPEEIELGDKFVDLMSNASGYIDLCAI